MTYIKSETTHKRLGSWHIQDSATGQTLCGYKIAVEKSQLEVPAIGCCARCLRVRAYQAQQAKQGAKA